MTTTPRSSVSHKVRRSVALIALANTLLGLVCSPPAKMRQVTARDSSRTLAVHVADDLIVSLESNPTTGYRWRWMDSSRGSMAAVRGPVYLRDSAPEHALGVGGIESFHFRPTQKGPATLVFEYRHPWEPPESTAVGRVRFRFDVR